MCSIMGYCKAKADLAGFKKGFAKTLSRGPDDSRIIDTGKGLLGFHRLAIMGLSPEGMQPFELDGSYAVCNGEIYGYEKIKAALSVKYSFKSGSDCEILLPMYREYGTDMFAMLDAEFALIIYDGKTGEFIAARDPIGIRPLYYGYDGDGALLLASEAKNLVGICEKIMPFPPGCYMKGGKFIRYSDISHAATVCHDDLETVCKNIHDKLIAGVEKRLVSDAKVGFLLSGGLDSSLVCAIAARKSTVPIRTFAIGMEGDAIDLKYAREVADYIGSEHTEVYMTREQVLSELENVISILGTFDITTIRASMGMYLLCMTESFTIAPGDTLVLLCALGFTAHILVIDRFSQTVDCVRMSMIQFFVCALISGICMIVFERPDIEAVLSAWLPILYAGALSSGVGYTLQIVAQKDTPPVLASLLMSLESVFAVLAGWLILGQTLTAKELCGCGLMFAAIILAQIAKKTDICSTNIKH